MIIRYDGSRYNGWQKQGNTTNTIQKKIEEVLSKATNEEIEIYGSGRTDAGVHAIGQVANFHSNFEIDKEKEILGCTLKEYLNEYLPLDIRILAVCRVSGRFHSRLTVKSKKYVYIIDNGEVADPFTRKYAYHYKKDLNINLMEQGASHLIGEHDFLGFSSIKKTKKSTVRKISDITIEKKEEKIHIAIQGNGFLYNMVRIIVGTLIEVGEKKLPPEDVKRILVEKDRSLAGPTVPPTGLFLYGVDY